jgi:hypothetical protein
VAFAASGCQALDVIGRRSVSSLAAVVDALPQTPQLNEEGFWELAAPDSSAALLLPLEPGGQAALVTNAAPFEAAGLRPDKLPEGMSLTDAGRLRIEAEPFEGAGRRGLPARDTDSAQLAAQESLLARYAELVRLDPERIGYHSAMDHFGINLGGGNMLEWAQDLKSGDKDLVFVLDPAPLKQAGVDVENIEGWVFAPVEVMKDGKMVEVDKLLKPFDLK